MNTTLFSAKSVARLQEATKLMDEIMASDDDASLYRSKMRKIESQLDCAGVAPGKFLSDYFQKIHIAEAPVQPSKAVGKSSKPMGNTISWCKTESHTRQCRGCSQYFTPKAFNGHGERRCLLKYGKEVPDE